MQRAQPQGKGLFNERWRKWNQEMHKKRLRMMRPSIDNSEPRVYSHLQTKKKREQLLLERYSQIERENRILLEKMAEIMGRPTYSHPSSASSAAAGSSAIAIRSLNAESRRRNLERITDENQQILKRIQTSGPNYDHREWEQHWSNQQVYLRNLCEFPCILLDEAANKKEQARRKATPLQLDREAGGRDDSRRQQQQQARLKQRSASPSKARAPRKASSSSATDLQRPAKSAGRSRRKTKRKAKTSAMAAAASAGAPRVLAREGKNINGVYVIVSVSETSPTNWCFVVYDPQYSDEVTLAVPLAKVAEMVPDRVELFAASQKEQLATLAISFLSVESKEGKLQARFGAADQAAAPVVPAPAPSATAASYDEDEFGTQRDMEAPVPPQPLFPQAKQQLLPDIAT